MVKALCYKPEVMGSSANNVIEFFNLPIPSTCTVALGFTQSLTEMSTRRSFWE
jgi:hypothetical protein